MGEEMQLWMLMVQVCCLNYHSDTGTVRGPGAHGRVAMLAELALG